MVVKFGCRWRRRGKWEGGADIGGGAAGIGEGSGESGDGSNLCRLV